MRDILLSNQYKKDLKKARKQGRDETELDNVIKMLANDIVLPKKYNDHDLKGRLRGLRECHVTSDWLLIYKKLKEEVEILRLYRLGTHSELLGL